MVVVQFSVDLAQESMAPSDVIYLQSTFNGWCGDCAPMARLSPSSDVWVRNETRPDGEWIEWKFTIGVWNNPWNITEDVPIECDVTGGAWHNRGIVVSSGVMSRTPRVDFGEEGINMLTVRVSHQMASQI